MDISNHPVLVRTIQPTVAIMNNGPKKGGDPATVRLLEVDPLDPGRLPAPQNVDTAAEDNTDASLIANAEPAGGNSIHVAVSPGRLEVRRADRQWGTEAGVRVEMSDAEWRVARPSGEWQRRASVHLATPEPGPSGH